MEGTGDSTVGLAVTGSAAQLPAKGLTGVTTSAFRSVVLG